MNKKLIIQIIVIVVAFGGAGLVLYNGLFKGSSSQTASTAVSTDAGSQESILPYGSSYGFPGTDKDYGKVLKRNNLLYNLALFPKMDLSEVGILVTNLITPLPPQTDLSAKK